MDASVAGDIAAIWNHVRDHATGRQIGAIISKSELVDFSKGRAVIETDASVANLAEGKRDAISSLMAQATGESVLVELRAAKDAIGPNAETSENPADRLPSADEITGRPLVQETLSVFDAKITRVTPRRPTNND